MKSCLVLFLFLALAALTSGKEECAGTCVAERNCNIPHGRGSCPDNKVCCLEVELTPRAGNCSLNEGQCPSAGGFCRMRCRGKPQLEATCGIKNCLCCDLCKGKEKRKCKKYGFCTRKQNGDQQQCSNNEVVIEKGCKRSKDCVCCANCQGTERKKCSKIGGKCLKEATHKRTEMIEKGCKLSECTCWAIPCKELQECTDAKGTCVRKEKDCPSGILEKKYCKGKKCKCCLPQASTTTTTDPTTNTSTSMASTT
ncbi:cell death abnormality protein 1-like [Penaeus indicus]|uniref:cell death abnormality protein 1-like n=1 Tax=Penaeus indicus TaxID=29960 RepID=UPI00300CFC47